MTATFYVGDAIEVMSKLPEKSVDLILTSPPFLALRSYLPADHPDKSLEGGSQSTPGEFIDWLIDVVEACDRVLAPHGSLCLELGDTYSGSGGAGGDYTEDGLRAGQPRFEGSDYAKRLVYGREDGSSGSGRRHTHGGAWPLAKSLSLIPETFRFALVYGHNPLTGRQTERWRLRNVIRWVRPNPPVGALGDKFRPATSELMVFCKSAKRYFDLDAVREPHTPHALKYYTDGAPYLERLQADESRHAAKGKTPGRADGGFMQSAGVNPAGAPPLDWSTGLGARIDSAVRDAWDRAKYDQPNLFDGNHATEQAETVGQKIVREFTAAALLDGGDAIIQPPGGYPGAHYAVWGPVLLPPFIKAMSPERVCRVCGEPSRRIVGEATYERDGELVGALDAWPWGGNEKGRRGERKSNDGGITRQAPTLGFSDCGHGDYRAGLVLDPFGGSGTTALVATGHGRDCILIDLDERNYDLALQRVGPLMLERAG